MSVTSSRTGVQGDSLLATCVLDGVKATWIRDNGPARLMPRTLFPDASDELIKKSFAGERHTGFYQYLLGRK